jgi:antitoxin component YwqK of YwqJK toxin-antitoxin module
MKTIYIITILFLAGTMQAQQNTEQILASNNKNNGKPEQTFLVSQFPAMNASELNGVYKLLSENGSIREVRTFDMGKPDGTWIQYDDNQNIIAIANYKNNLKHGKWIIWDSNGIKRSELFYENGKRAGKWSIWNEEGDLISFKEY